MNKYFEEEINYEIYLNENLNICRNCKSNDIREIDGYSVCVECGFCNDNVVFEKNSYKFGLNYITIYTRFNHWKKILRSVQAEQISTVPLKIIEDLKKEKFETIQELKKIMVMKKYSKWYLSIYWIYKQIKNEVLIEFDKMTYWRLLSLFQEISSEFNDLRLENRKNFLNYHYILCKCLRIINETKHIEYLFKMKDVKKLRFSENIMKSISNNLGLEFYEEPYLKRKRYSKVI